MSQTVIIYPGTFDPLTYGHIDIIERGARLGDQLIVAVSLNLGKQPLFSIEERTELVEAEVARINDANKTGLPVLVKSFSGLLTDFATQQGATSILRGLRAVADFEYEFHQDQRRSPQRPRKLRKRVVGHQRKEPHEQNPRGDLRDLRVRGAAG